MDFASFLKLTDSYKSWLVRIKPGEEIEDYTWVQHGVHTNTYYTAYTNGVPDTITEDDTELEERFSLSEVNTNAGSWFYDYVNQVLYVHTVNTDSPGKQTVAGTYDYKYLLFAWYNFCNSNPTDTPVIFPRTKIWNKNYNLESWLSATNLWKWTEGLLGTTTINRDDTEVETGAYCARIDNDAGASQGWFYKTGQLPPGIVCKLTVVYKMSNANTDARLYFYDSGSNVHLDENGDWQSGAGYITLDGDTDYQTLEIEFSSYADYEKYVFKLSNDVGTTGGSESIYFDIAKLEIKREDNYFFPLLNVANVPDIEQSVGDYHEGDLRMSFGNLKFLNDGFWYERIKNMIWNHVDVEMKYGRMGDNYDEYGLVFTGYTRNPVVSDDLCSIKLLDKNILTYKNLPTTKYWESDYANLEDGTEGVPIPIIYGFVEGISPIMTDDTTYTYTVACHEVNDITDVYKDDVALVVGVGNDYTVDTASGEFTLLDDPGDSLITCDVEGKKCDMEDGTYSANVADIILDLLINYLNVEREDIHYSSFVDLKNSRSQDHLLYIDIDQSGKEIVRRLQGSALFHLIPTVDGKIGAFRYVEGVDSDTPRMIDEKYINFQLDYITEGIYSKVKIKYNRNPTEQIYSVIEREDANVFRKYGIERTFIFVSTLKEESDAENIGDYYMDLVNSPLKKITSSLPSEIFNLRPAEKVILNKTRLDRDGNNYTVLSEEPYRILSLRKSLKTGRVSIIALEDLQSAGEVYCENCFSCQSCNTSQQGITGSCTSCYSCQKCDSGECSSCEACYYCEKCNTGECSSCESCNTCQLCNTGECSTCEVCDLCEKCDSGQCALCQTCDVCQKCDSGECIACESCDACENCITCEASECASCFSCELCDTCQNSECAVCQNCNTCQTCNICQNSECSSCESCDSCQTCDSCEKCDSGECSSCENCDSCQKCNTCQNSECSSCETCNVCQKCDTGECSSCETCYSCEKCNTGQCFVVDCGTGECPACFVCQDCVLCESCNTCETCVSFQ